MDRPGWMSRRALGRIVLAVLIPPVAILAALHSQPLGAAAFRRPGLLAIGLITVAMALAFKSARRVLLVALAYGTALIALLGILRSRIEGPPADIGALAPLYLVGWVILFLLATTAGTLEILHPGTVFAKRCLFAAAAVFLVGHGIVGLATLPNAFSAAAIVAGFLSAFAAVMAHRLLAVVPQPPEPDTPTAAALAALRRERLRRREWRDGPAVR